VVDYFLPYFALVVDGIISFGLSEGGESLNLRTMGGISVVMGRCFGLCFESDDLIAVYLDMIFIEVIMGDSELFAKHSRLFYNHVQD